MQSQVDDSKSKIVTSQTRIAVAEGKIVTLEKEVATSESKIAISEGKITALESQVATPTLLWTGQTTGDHSVVSSLPPSVRSSYAAATNNTNYYTTTISSGGTYLVVAHGRLADWHYRKDNWWSMRVYNKKRSTTLFTSFGTHRHSYEGGNTMDASTSGFWIGKLNEGDVLEQQYHLEGPSTEDVIFFQDQHGSSAIYAIRIGK
ncbi:unnamed protein product [Rotaria sp. Silwood1]|nr:unnamed protein product [Rotaria sp. Silwood1]CAF1627989.1 unnamed protein product [Rotaria sp. Silwood1]CAF1629675.1 unnamed protein product [Rotaria sp. Silwood1]CAF3894342.1 unnamed protein product [Rotaria sp. Silwood1]CAF5062754.1 unnamed protein product [Rotaria sp. Silwood1]